MVMKTEISRGILVEHPQDVEARQAKVNPGQEPSSVLLDCVEEEQERVQQVVPALPHIQPLMSDLPNHQNSFSISVSLMKFSTIVFRK